MLTRHSRFDPIGELPRTARLPCAVAPVAIGAQHPALFDFSKDFGSTTGWDELSHIAVLVADIVEVKNNWIVRAAGDAWVRPRVLTSVLTSLRLLRGSRWSNSRTARSPSPQSRHFWTDKYCRNLWRLVSFVFLLFAATRFEISRRITQVVLASTL